MNHAIKTALLWAGIYITLELILFTFDLHRNQVARFIGFGSNTLCLLLAISISIITNFNKHKHEGVSIVADLKTGIKTGVVYSLIIASFLFSYYKWVDPGYQKAIMQQYIAYSESEAFTEGAIEAKQGDDGLATLSSDDLRDNAQINAEEMLSIKTVFPMSLMALLMLSIFYSFIVTGFNRIILSKLR